MKIKYKCEKCDNIYHNKYDYYRHLNRKRPCKSTNQNNESKLNPN